MPNNEALNPITDGAPEGGDGDDLDRAIDDLRGVLKKVSEPAEAAMPAADDPPALQATADNGAAAGAVPPAAEEPLPAPPDPGDAAGLPATTGATGSTVNSDIIMDIPVEVQIVLGKTRMKVSSLMKLDEGATISLDRRIGEPVEIMVNGQMIGRGEITVLEDDESRFGVKLTEILAAKPAGDG